MKCNSVGLKLNLIKYSLNEIDTLMKWFFYACWTQSKIFNWKIKDQADILLHTQKNDSLDLINLGY